MKKADFTSNLIVDSHEEAIKRTSNQEQPKREAPKKADLKSYCLHLPKETLFKLRNIAFEEDKTINEIILRAIEKEIKSK